MKILIPVLGFAASGGYRVLSELASQWADQGHQVDFLTPQGEALPSFPTRAKLISVSFSGRIGNVGDMVETVSFRGFRKLVALYRGVRAIGGNYDIVLANHSLTPWPIFLAIRNSRVIYYYIQAYEPEYFIEMRAPIKWLLARLSYFLPITQIANTAVYNHHIGVRPSAIIPPGVDLELYHAKARSRDFADGAPIVLGCIGRHEPAKGTKYVLEAFTVMAEEDARIWLRIAYGNLPEGWTHPRCEIVVPRNDAELADYYRSIDIMIAPGTLQLGAPHYPVMEAMACATPVVTTGYLPSTPENSWLVATRDPDAIGRSVRSIIADPHYSNRVDLASRAMMGLAWPVAAERFLKMFEKRGYVKLPG